MKQLSNVARTLEFQEKRGEDLEGLVRRMYVLITDMDIILDANQLSLDFEQADRRASVAADVDRLVGLPKV